MRVFRFDKKKNTLTIQVVIMIIIAFVMFVQYSLTHRIIFLVLMALAIAFLGIYLYRIFFMRIIFEEDSVTYKGFSKQYRIEKDSIYGINILCQKGKEYDIIEYKRGVALPQLPKRAYVVIRANDKPLNTNISMFNAANDDYITLEYTKGLEVYLDKLLTR